MSVVWQNIQADIKNKIGTSAYESWFSSIHAIEEGGALLLETPDDFFKTWIEDHYLAIIRQALAEQSSEPMLVSVTVNSGFAKEAVQRSVTQSTPAPAVDEKEKDPRTALSLTARFSFDNFVIGPSNHFAFAACKAVAESPAKSYNPLFLYSQVGLGKTHLMQSVAHEIKKRFPEKKCVYLSSEYFTNELIDSIKNRTTTQFRQKYRNIDVILIDDIHFIAGKEATQEEFFHTFNALHNSHKQIVISSDRPPKEIANLEERLVSRFTWGLIADIQPPDFETRVAILRKKLEREPVNVPEEVIFFIAEQIKTNIRELEGALIRVVAYSMLEERPVGLETAKAVLKDMVQETAKVISVDTIQKEVARFFDLSLTELKSKKRSKNIIIPRQISMYLARKLTNLSLPEIGGFFGGKDHTTILHAYRKIEKELDENMELKKQIDRIITFIKQ
ncbi:MAG TPA: chromosomal replication initiator protein DnaA [Candidatus Omnitrophota bacterium]|jgi:chromosomal replication initiator protein|nr:chromosomal replication initiator protein DnaA [Candidatus Omnitrophota bacterium]HSA30359.1 chromosomal replication initiator protein DnaA [Candidatus Omnitrophota bacterium]